MRINLTEMNRDNSSPSGFDTIRGIQSNLQLITNHFENFEGDLVDTKKLKVNEAYATLKAMA